jgi:hypothetical protein
MSKARDKYNKLKMGKKVKGNKYTSALKGC